MENLNEFMVKKEFESVESWEITNQPFTYNDLSTLVELCMLDGGFGKILIVSESEDLSFKIASSCSWKSKRFRNLTKDIDKNRVSFYVTFKDNNKSMMRTFPLIETDKWISKFDTFVNDTDKILIILINDRKCETLDKNKVKYLEELSLNANISLLKINNYIKDELSMYKHIMKNIITNKTLYTLDGKMTYNLTDEDFERHELVGKGDIITYIPFLFEQIEVYDSYETEITLSDNKTIIFPEKLYVDTEYGRISLYELKKKYFNY